MGKARRIDFCKYFLLTAALSFLGWAFEVSYVYLKTGQRWDAGFLTLPFCPIYGCSLLAIYLLCGTPHKGRGVLKGVKSTLLRNILYLGFAFLIPTMAELIVGAFFDKALHLRLWSYQKRRYNYHGYICLPVSLAWMGLIWLVMRFVFPFIKKGVFRLNDKLGVTLSVVLSIALGIDAAWKIFSL